MERVGLSRGNQARHPLKGFFGRFAPLGKPDAGQHAVNMNIHGENIPPEREKENTGRSLDPDPIHSAKMRKSIFIGHRSHVFQMRVVPQLEKNPADPAGLLIRKTSGADSICDHR